MLCTTQATTGASGLVLCAVAPTLTSCTLSAQTSILPTAAIGTSEGPSAGYPATGDKGFTARPLFFVRGGYIYYKIEQTLTEAGHIGLYYSNTIRAADHAYYLGLSIFKGPSNNSSGTRANGHFLR